MARLLETSEVARKLKRCRRCDLSKQCYSHGMDDDKKVRPVPGEGPVTAELVFVARNPGRLEDKLGRPLVGQSGEGPFQALLDAINISRKKVGIVNIVSCFTTDPFNREPKEDEVDRCRENLVAQVGFFKKRKVVVTLGKMATDWAMRADIPVTSVEGRVMRNTGDPVAYIPIRHPSYFLRNRTEAKRFGRLKLPRIVQAIHSILSS